MAINNYVSNASILHSDFDGAGWNVTIKADSGYMFDGVVTAEWQDTSGDFTGGDLELNHDATEASIYIFGNVNHSTLIMVYGNTKLKEVSLNITNHITNTVDNSYYDDVINLVIDTADGYIFDGDVTAGYMYTGEYMTTTLTISSDGKQATAPLDVPTSTNIDINGNTVADAPPSLNVIVNIDNTVNNSYYDGAIKLVIDTVDGYIFNGIITAGYMYTGEYMAVDLVISSDGKQATATLNVPSNTVINVSGNTVPIPSLNIVNYVDNTVNNSYYENEVTFIIIDVAEGYVFDGEVIASYLYLGDYLNFSLNINEDATQATRTLTAPLGTLITITGETKTKDDTPTIGEAYGSINVYKVTSDDLKEFAEKRYFKLADGDTNSYESVDLGMYVNRIKRIHVNIEATQSTFLRCGNYNTGIEVLVPDTDKIELNFGEVLIPEYNYDVVDYEGEIKMFLPFNGFIDIPSDYVGRSIQLEYIINNITGGGVARLSCDGVVFMIEPLEPSSNVIYRTAYNDSALVGDDTFNELLLYGLEPYVYVKWYDSNTENGINAYEKICVIGECTGFISMQYVELVTNEQMLLSEQQLIYEHLEDGVYIM